MRFDVVVRMRADLAWEVVPAMPAPALLTSGHVHFPWMSHCHGYNDKFAVGTSRATSTLCNPNPNPNLHPKPIPLPLTFSLPLAYP